MNAYGRFPQHVMLRRPVDPRVGQFWRDLLYGARGPRPPFPDPAPEPQAVEPTPLNETPFSPPPTPVGPVGAPRTPTALDIQQNLADALRRGPLSPSPISDVPIVRVPAVVTCRGNCTLFTQPGGGLVLAQLGPGTRLRRVGAPVTASSGAAWLQVDADITDNFNVRTVRGYVPVSDLQELSTLPTPPPAGGNQPPINEGLPGGLGDMAAAPSIVKTAFEVVLLTSPAWGAFLLSRFLR